MSCKIIDDILKKIKSIPKPNALFYIKMPIALKSSPPFPLAHTVRATFTAYGAPSSHQRLLSFTGTYGFI